MHIQVEIPKSLSERQIALLKEFEEEEAKKRSGAAEKLSSTLEKAWDRLKKFMGTDSNTSTKSESN